MLQSKFNRLAGVLQICRIAWGLLAVCALLSAAGWRPMRAADDEAPTESDVKAAMIYNFAQFIEWPESSLKSSSGPFVIGVFGEDPVESVLEDTLKGETFERRAVQVRRLSAPNDARQCDILFVSSSEKKRTAEILESIRGKGTLTIGDTEDFISLGGMIAFTKQGNKIRFQINPDAAARSGLKISSKLLRLAIVQDESGSRGSG
jgi:hypothetical protein